MIEQFTKETKLKSKGVYLISHSKTDVKYVGSTITYFQERWRAHLNGLKRGIGNTVLLNICKKYGIEGFNFSILEIMDNSSLEEIRERERYWIDKLDTYENGANCTLDTMQALKSVSHKPYTEEDKFNQMMSSPTKKTVYLYDIKGNLLYIFPSTCACDRFFGLTKKTTNWAINHPIRSICKQYYPSYELKNWIPEEEIKYRKKQVAIKVAQKRKDKGSYIITENTKNKLRNNHSLSKPVALYNKEGNLIRTFVSQNECDDFLGLTRGSTSKCLKGKCKTLKRIYIPKLI